MKVKVIGIYTYKYGNKGESAKNKDGMILHCTKPLVGGTGEAVKEVKLWHEQLEKFRTLQMVHVGDEINLDYDDNKYLIGVDLIQPQQTPFASEKKGMFAK